jgi:hypothetical protein
VNAVEDSKSKAEALKIISGSENSSISHID